MSNIFGYGRPKWVMKQRDDLCSECKGKGYTYDTSPVIKDGVTLAQGSGCPTCKGTGKC